MHAQARKRYTPNSSVGLFLALGLLASIALAAATFDWPNDDPASLPGAQADLALLAKEQRYYNAKMARLEEAEAAAGAQYAPAPQTSSIEWSPGQIVIDQYVLEVRAATVAREQLLAEYEQYNPALPATSSEPDPGVPGLDHFQVEPRAETAGPARGQGFTRY